MFKISDSGYNPRFDLSYAPNEDLTTYISAAKGYRPGGPAGPNYPSFCGGGQTPPYSPDTVWDYEIGEKAKVFDNWLTINSDFYYIKWSKVQETVRRSSADIPTRRMRAMAARSGRKSRSMPN